MEESNPWSSSGTLKVSIEESAHLPAWVCVTYPSVWLDLSGFQLPSSKKVPVWRFTAALLGGESNGSFPCRDCRWVQCRDLIWNDDLWYLSSLSTCKRWLIVPLEIFFESVFSPSFFHLSPLKLHPNLEFVTQCRWWNCLTCCHTIVYYLEEGNGKQLTDQEKVCTDHIIDVYQTLFIESSFIFNITN